MDSIGLRWRSGRPFDVRTVGVFDGRFNGRSDGYQSPRLEGHWSGPPVWPLLNSDCITMVERRRRTNQRLGLSEDYYAFVLNLSSV